MWSWNNDSGNEIYNVVTMVYHYNCSCSNSCRGSGKGSNNGSGRYSSIPL